MTKLSDTQAIVLSAAAQRDDRNVLPLPGSLRGGAARNVVTALLKCGLIAETVTDSQTKADAALNRIWHNDADGRAILLHITDAGHAAIGVEPEGGDSAPKGADAALSARARKRRGESKQTPPKDADDAPARKPREGTKQALVIAMLRRKEGATITQITEASQWRPHTVRGFFAGTLKKKLGLAVSSEKVGDRRVYRLTRE